jgi:transposase
MYVRFKTNPNSPRTAIQIVQSVRKGDRIVQKIVRHVGVAMDKDELTSLKLLAESIKVKLESGPQGTLWRPEELAEMVKHHEQQRRRVNESDYIVNIKNLREEERVVQGIHEVYGTLFDELSFQTIFAKPTKTTIKLFRDIVMARIANPQSKKGSVDLLEEDFGVSLNLTSVYRMMDRIDDVVIDRLNDLAYQHTKQLFPEKIDIIFFDCTTLYFESFTEDDFKKNGYSKDLKFNQPQVLLALMVTKEGLPIGYRAFPGDTYEGHTIVPIIKEIQTKYDLDKVVFVADSALFSKDNLKEIEKLEDHGIEYIVGARLKNLPQKLQAQVLNKNNYVTVKEGCAVSAFEYSDRQLIVNYSAKRAKKDAHDRERAIERLTKKLQSKKSPKEYLSNHGYKKYLKVVGKSTIQLDKEKIKTDSQWDGLHGVITNAKQLSNQEILEQYNNLWQIENAFRITKHDLKVRPIFHWKPERVKAHLAICFTAYMLVKYLEYRVRLQYARLSPETIRQELVRVQTSILYDRKKKIRYALPSRMSQDAKKIYHILGLARITTPYILEKK